MLKIRLGETRAALKEIQFTSVQSANLQNRILGATLANAAITVKIKKGGIGTAVAGGAGAFTAVDDTNAPGVRGYCPDVSELFLGMSTFVFTGAAMEPREVPVQVEQAYFGTAVTGSLAAGAFTTSRTEAVADFWKNALLLWHTGALAGQVQKVSGYTVSGGAIAVVSPFTAAPANGDLFELLDR